MKGSFMENSEPGVAGPNISPGINAGGLCSAPQVLLESAMPVSARQQAPGVLIGGAALSPLPMLSSSPRAESHQAACFIREVAVLPLPHLCHPSVCAQGSELSATSIHLT